MAGAAGNAEYVQRAVAAMTLASPDWATHREICEAIDLKPQGIQGRALEMALQRLSARGESVERREITRADFDERPAIDSRTCWLWRWVP